VRRKDDGEMRDMENYGEKFSMKNSVFWDVIQRGSWLL
jgi:hypothetical protein